MKSYHNENDPFCVQWLRNLIGAGLIPDGDVDGRSIVDVCADDVRGYRQCHFFAGIAGWPLALELAGWPSEREVWTGSCPCQPFSCAGKRKGTSDERHLWPVWHELIAVCKPATVFGEQVASRAGREWLAAVRLDLETLGYAVRAADLCAAGVGAPHIRQRLFFVAYAERERGGARWAGEEGGWKAVESDRYGATGVVADSFGSRLEVGREQSAREKCAAAERGGEAGRLGDAECERTGRDAGTCFGAQEGIALWPVGDDAGASGSTIGELGDADRSRSSARCEAAAPMGHGSAAVADGRGHWSELEWLPCRDGRWRPTQPGLFPLAHGVSGRVGRLRAYGNAIVPQVAAEFIKAACECIGAA